MDKTQAKNIQSASLIALQEAASKLGLTVTQAGGSYGEDNSLKLSFNFKSSDPALIEASERKLFGRYCHFYGLKPEAYKAQLTPEYTLIGFNPSAPKYPLIGLNARSQRMRLTEAYLRYVAPEFKVNP